MRVNDQISSDFLLNYNLLTFEIIDSTNEAAKRLARSGAAGNFLIISNQQSNGHGQQGKTWSSLDGNLHLTIMLETQLKLDKIQELVFLTSVSIAKYIEILTNNECKIELKWPNDIMCNGKKLGGILLETLKTMKRQFVIIGIGINLTKKPDIKDREVTCFREQVLHNEVNYNYSPERFMTEFIKYFDLEYNLWINNNHFEDIRQQWLSRAYNLHKTITINDGQRKISGIFKDIDNSGAIILELANGDNISLCYGELLPDA